MDHETFESDVPRQDCKLVVYNVPLHTIKEDICSLLESWVPSIKVIDAWFLTPMRPKIVHYGGSTVHTLLSFVTLSSNRERDMVVKYFQSYNRLHSSGYPFTNSKGKYGNVYADYCFPKPNDVSKRKRSNIIPKSRSKDFKIRIGKEEQMDNTSDTPSNCCLSSKDVKTLKQLAMDKDFWEKERRKMIKYIKLLEETLKEKSPALFVSELEMFELKGDVNDLSEIHRKKLISLDQAREELKDVKEQYQQLQMLDAN